jgi:two-component system nitrate/nitrite response regulator NarL
VAGSSEVLNVLVIDDHPIVKRAVSSVLEREAKFEVRSASNAAEAMTLCRTAVPDVALCDLSLGSGMSGLELIALLHETYPKLAIVVFSSFTDAEKVRAALEAGAIGYVAKSTEPRDLPNMLEMAAEGYPVYDANTQRVVLDLVRTSWNPPPKGELTLRELEILTCLCQEGGTTKEIAGLLHLRESTVATHLQSVFRKLDVPTRTRAITEAYKRGLVAPPTVT